MSARRILVTGASGFIGGHLVRHLEPHAVRAAGRGPRPVGFPTDWLQLGPNPDQDVLTEALAGVDTVVHAAGRAHIRRDTESDPLAAFRAANTEWTRALARASARAGVRRFILLSSISVYGAKTGRIDLGTPAQPATPYGRSRVEAEGALSEVCRDSELECVSLRLPMVYGPGMKGNPLALFDFVAHGHFLPLGAIRNERSVMYVGNVADAVRGLIDCALTSRSATFLAADEDTVSTPELAREIAAALGRRGMLVPVPVGVLRAAARLGTAVAGHRFPLSTNALQSLVTSLVLDTTALAATIGRAPPFGRKEALRLTAEWYLAQPV